MPPFRASWISALLLPLALAGCSNSPYDGDGVAEYRPLRTVLKEAAGEYLKGKAKGELRDAYRRQDTHGMRAAIESYDWAEEADKPPQEAADRLVQQANNLFGASRQLTGEDRNNQLQQADGKYRLALKFYPRMATASNDRDLLNSVGYYLADRGESAQDLKLAEALTRRSLQLWNNDSSQANLSDDDRRLFQLRRAQEPMDSLAWALYRQHRYAEAKQLAEAAARIIRSLGGETETDAAIPFHRGEIYRALGETAAARREYASALRSMQADVETEERIQKGLAALPGGSANLEGVSQPGVSPRP